MDMIQLLVAEPDIYTNNQYIDTLDNDDGNQTVKIAKNHDRLWRIKVSL
jgi:hypothetical protein